MELLGDLERAFASAIYPNRVLIGIVGLLIVAGLAVLAWRRRWDLVARRHPRPTIVGLVLAVAIIGPLGWYLGSPLVLSSTIDELPPLAARVSESNQPAIERSGSFSGADEFHFGSGTARLIETAPGLFSVRLEDFDVRNGPDLFVYLSPSADGYADGAIEVGRLKADRGNQNYEVRAGSDVSSARSVVIWCKQFAVQFAVAPLE